MIKNFVGISSKKETWSEYTLSDGNTIRVKPVPICVESLIGKFSPSGDPIYSVKSRVAVEVLKLKAPT